MAMKAERERRGIALLFFTFDARWGWVVNVTPQPLYPRELNPVPIV
jgi:catalase